MYTCDVYVCECICLCVYIWHVHVCVCLHVCMCGVCMFVFLCGVVQCTYVCEAPSIHTGNFSLPFESILKHVPQAAKKADTESNKGQNRFTHSLFLKSNLVLCSQMLTEHGLNNKYQF